MRPKPSPASSAKKRKPSSQRWLQRQNSDPYVAEARRRGYRSRAAFKLIELDDRHHFLKPGAKVLDLGAAPGGWTQVAAERVCPHGRKAQAGRVVAVDILPMDPLPNVVILCADLLDETTPARIVELLAGAADLVLSDMSPSTTGHPGTDHLRIMAMAEAAFTLATEVLAEGGAFVCKVFQGGTQDALLGEVKRRFERVRHAKPPASRAKSAEIYLVATGFHRQG